MRKLLIAVLSVFLLLCGCTDEENKADPAAAAELSSAIDATNSETRFSGQYMLEINFGEGVSLYYALGNAMCDRVEEKASVIFSQTYLGVSRNVENYIADGRIVSVNSGVSTEIEQDAKAAMAKFPYSKIYEYSEELGAVTVSNSTLGKVYTVKRNDTEAICDTVIGGDIYSLVDVLKRPQTDKTEYSETTCSYTVSDGKVVGCRYEFDIKLFDTPAYIPGYSQPENEYTIELHVIAKISYDEFGESATVAEYSETSEN